MDKLGPVESSEIDAVAIGLCVFALFCLGFLIGVLVERNFL